MSAGQELFDGGLYVILRLANRLQLSNEPLVEGSALSSHGGANTVSERSSHCGTKHLRTISLLLYDVVYEVSAIDYRLEKACPPIISSSADTLVGLK